MTMPILFSIAIAICIIVVILFVRSERRKDRAYASALPSRRQHDCANLHIDDDIAEIVAIANKAADARPDQLLKVKCLAGRSWEQQASEEAAATRITAQEMIDKIDSVLGRAVDSNGIPINHPSDDPLSEYTPRYVEAPINNSCNYSDSSSFSCDSSSDSGSSSSD